VKKREKTKKVKTKKRKAGEILRLTRRRRRFTMRSLKNEEHVKLIEL
jgi:hypothetical protein